MSSILSAQNITKLYPHRAQTVVALNNISLSFKENTFTAILGRSGSGKTTLLHILSSLDKPTSGEVFLYGKKLSTLSDQELVEVRQKHVGFIFQDYMLLNELTVYENVVLPFIIENRIIDTTYIEDLLHTLGLWEQKDYYPYQLSGGQIQRTSIARSLSTRPSIIFADEPTGQLDRKTSNEVLELLLLSSRKYNMTIILVTHDLKLAQMADQILYLNNGQITKDMEA